MIARLRARFWGWLAKVAEDRWARAHDAAYPPDEWVGEPVRWIVTDAAYMPIWAEAARDWEENVAPHLPGRKP